MYDTSDVDSPGTAFREQLFNSQSKASNKANFQVGVASCVSVAAFVPLQYES